MDFKVGVSLTRWSAPEHPDSVDLNGQYCRLVPLDPGTHSESLFKAFADDTADFDWVYLPYGPFNTNEQLKAWLEAVASEKDPLFFTILNTHNQPIGIASYLRINPVSGSIEVGHIHFSPALQRTPTATEAMYLMMRYAFELGYRRYEWKCDALNNRSRRAALRLGLSFEGIFRQATVYKSRNRDTAWFAAIDSEWPALKVAFETWLKNDNFDQDGKQRLSLSKLTTPILSPKNTSSD
ncbi:MAG: GNAT family N-acetyltransferase [Proteobacteria bacterium]|nr:GNAT family N-acetyltransferase [Pseudomonadota bacterium]MBT7672281.1 GNAT family N-acetyltransferase [Pseudomonadota bacterium]MBT7812934.1 GNAT family N-acetyltransferase [Pseudomonadota bacterium]